MTLSTEHHTYKVGQTIPISVVLKDVSSQRVAVRQGHNVGKLTVLEGSTVVYEKERKFPAFASGTIKPGHALKLTTMWSGSEHQVGVKKLTPGTYTIEVDDNGYVASTTVQVVSSHQHAPAGADRR